MKKIYIILFAFLSESSLATETPLMEEMKVLDEKVFAAFNRCSDPKELDTYASYFSPDVEFYHDNGGVTWDRASMISNTKKYVCGIYTRELVTDSFAVHPIKEFGAIVKGEHVFCQAKTQECEGIADFVMVWRHTNNGWEITRVLSYGHRENK